MANTKDATSKILEQIKSDSKNIDITQREKLNKNYSLKMDKQSFKPEYIQSENIKRISIDNENNKVSLNLYNGFVLGIMGFIYNADFNTIKNALKTTPEYMVFNRLISSELNHNSEPFLKGLN